MTDYSNHTQDELNDALNLACARGHLHNVAYLLTSPELKEHANVHSQNGRALRYACETGHLEVVSFLLSSPKLAEHADIHAHDDLALIGACQCGQLEVVKYLLTSPELKVHANIHCDNDYPLRKACMNGHQHIVNFLLYDIGICVEEETYDNMNHKESNELRHMVAKRDLFFKINSSLDDMEQSNQSRSEIKPKI